MVILKMRYIITVGKSDKARVPIEYTVYTDTNCKVLSIFLLMGIWVSRDLYFWASRFGIAAGMVALSLKKKKKMDDLDLHPIFFRPETTDLQFTPSSWKMIDWRRHLSHSSNIYSSEIKTQNV